MINEPCPKCKAPQVTFYTLQMRSADEVGPRAQVIAGRSKYAGLDGILHVPSMRVQVVPEQVRRPGSSPVVVEPDAQLRCEVRVGCRCMACVRPRVDPSLYITARHAYIARQRRSRGTGQAHR
jgi:hypothetical protein